eukprot:CAMPEP_0172175286 /NCGR_PEP_ID=MMETSP1050-20130122/14138_1 /TAXON_ID=233186 /ORGANISM="Cryptomonas curvata, Strain CCAP979/52" /LENGTH=230 /DNA_ID=CAMNT_0012847361 /DNA_START=54 /DNA_END=743 /DNA_ORIENTATION=+
MPFMTASVSRSVGAVFSVFIVATVLLFVGDFDVLQSRNSPTATRSELSNPDRTTLLQDLDDEDQEKSDQASALFHLAGGKKMLSNTPDHFGDKELENKNEDALSILSKFFHKVHKSKKEPGPGANKASVATHRGRIQTSEAKHGSPAPANKELERMKARSEADVSKENPNEALQGLIAGWSGAGWWQPCAEVCRPTAGTKHTKANFKIYTDCEEKCRQTKTERLKETMQA